MGRGTFCLGLILALAACRGPADDPSPFAESRTPPQLASRFFAPEGWTWGFLQLNDGPVQRYGVSAPSVRPRAEVLILPDYGETAETWFETARDLNARGYTVWILEAQGQGGSQRIASPRDLGHVKSFEPDIAAVRAMARSVIRPTAPLIVLGQGVGAVIAVRALQSGLAPDGLILSSPAFTVRGQREAKMLRVLGLGARRAPGGAGWDARRATASTHDPWRGGVTAAWQKANPDLRMGGPSLDWANAYDEAALAARRDLAQVKAPSLVLEGGRAEGCLTLPECQATRWPKAGDALELERDPVRDAWLEAIDAFIRARLARSPDA
jgi:lysophospholipase